MRRLNVCNSDMRIEPKGSANGVRQHVAPLGICTMAAKLATLVTIHQLIGSRGSDAAGRDEMYF